MKNLLASMLLLCAMMAMSQNIRHTPVPRKNVPTGSIQLSDPFVFTDEDTHTYYMTGTGGLLWKSKDLRLWDGPYRITDTKGIDWMGQHPMIWAAEIHKYNGKYYYFATFTNQEVFIDTVQGNAIERRACHVLVSDKAEGPYRPVKGSDAEYLPADRPTLDATLWVDTDRKPYMLYCHEWLQNLNGTVESIPLKSDFSGTTGDSRILFRASDSPWSQEDGTDEIRPIKVTDGPFVFRTEKGTLGIIWTSWIRDIYTQGVAYSESGTLSGPWIQEPKPITPPNYGHGMIFKTFNGETLMSIHSHKIVNGRTIRIPHFFKVSLKGKKLKVKELIKQ